MQEYLMLLRIWQKRETTEKGKVGNTMNGRKRKKNIYVPMEMSSELNGWPHFLNDVIDSRRIEGSIWNKYYESCNRWKSLL